MIRVPPHRGETRRNRLKFHRHNERNTQDFGSVYFNLFLVILPNFGSLFYTTVIPYKPLYGTPLLGLPVRRPPNPSSGLPPPQSQGNQVHTSQSNHGYQAGSSTDLSVETSVEKAQQRSQQLRISKCMLL